jgi:hypothetical protein
MIVATPSFPTYCVAMPHLSKSTSSTTSICDYNAGVLDVSDHLTMKVNTHNKGTFVRSPNKKALAVMEIIMMMDCHKSEPLLDFDLNLLDEMLIAADAPKQSPKRVRFAEYDDIQLVNGRLDMSQEDMVSLYMSYEEQVAAKRSAFDELLLVTCMSQQDEVDSHFDGDSICIRGLENHMVDNAHVFRETVNRLYDIVHDCQTFEDDNGVLLPDDYLAQHLMQVSAQCSVEALQRAILDEQEVKKSQ